MVRRVLILLALLLAPAVAHARGIDPQLVAEGPAAAGGEVELAIVMHTKPGWHGYWLNPGDAGLPMKVEWTLPAGWTTGPLRYPVPTRLTIAGLMNYVYEQDYAVLVRLKAPPGAAGTIPIRAQANWLACTDKVCVPESGELSLDLPVGIGTPNRTRFDEWRRALPTPLASVAHFEIAGNRIRVGIPLPSDVKVEDAYVFPEADGPVDYAGKQSFTRKGELLIAELPRGSAAPARLPAVLALGDGHGLHIDAVPGPVPSGGSPIGGGGALALLWAVLGAIAGGILLNLMPCVFPILTLKALHLAKSGGDETEARRDALAYAAGAVIGTGALGLALLALRAGGSAAGWAFQLQDPRTVLVLVLLATAITLNLLRIFEVPVLVRSAVPNDSFATGALAAFVATPCSGPFLGAALGTALLLPAAGAIAVFASLGLGLALPFVAVAFIPALRRMLPRPGPWMVRLQRFLAIPMAATVVAGLWLLWRLGGAQALQIGLAASALVGLQLVGAGVLQRKGKQTGYVAALAAFVVAVAGVWAMPGRSAAAAHSVSGAAHWDEVAVSAQVAQGHPAFVYFTADWCLTCKVNEAAAINRSEVREAFKAADVKLFAGDWTTGDPKITRFLEARGRAGVPLYLWYSPGKAEPEELPQVLTPAMLTSRARAKR
jgi:DsbC/DsbD-like thiol-disulfide interchange protein/cytochrome c biogenesis protein CcdA